MKKIIIIIFLIYCKTGILIGQGFKSQIYLSSAKSGISIALTIGTDSLGSSQYDSGLDTLAAPPGLTYYAYLNSNLSSPYTYLKSDIRSSSSDSLVWSIVITNANDDTTTITWDSSSFSVYDSLFLSDGSVSYNMNNNNSAQFVGNKTLTISFIKIITSVTNEKLLPERYSLFQNYPNPFNNSTTIKFNVPYASRILLDIYDLQGRKVRSLVNTDYGAGAFNIIWDGTNNHGVTVATGVYLMKLQGKDFIAARKILFLK